MSSYKNILFDFGGVLFNIKFQNTINAFKNLGFPYFENQFSQTQINTFFAEYEKGKINETDFFNLLQKESSLPITPQQITDAWNRMLISYRLESMEYLKHLKNHYQLYLLSNTNQLHYNAFTRMLLAHPQQQSLSSYFTKAWYSHQIGLRKPNKECFEFILSDGGLQATETLFIDDTLANIEAAKALGFQTHFMLPEHRIETFL